LSKRSVELYQTPGDVRAFLADIQSRLDTSLMILRNEPSTACPFEISFEEACASKTFLLTCSDFMQNVVCTRLRDGRSYVDSMSSEVILVNPSPLSEMMISRGRYWLCRPA